jgi:hypothetical protein
MSEQVNVVIICPGARQGAAQSKASQVLGGVGMFTTGCSPSGNAPATHWASAGTCAAEIPDILADELPQTKIYYDTPWQAVLDELGLKVVNPDEGKK